MSTTATMTRKQWLQELLTRSGDGRFPAIARDQYGVQCAYRDAKGNACAAGLLIPDEVYHRGFEGKSAYWLTHDAQIALPEGVTRRMVEDAQHAHDSTAVKLCDGGFGKTYEAIPWDRALFLNCLRNSPELANAFAAEGLVIE